MIGKLYWASFADWNRLKMSTVLLQYVRFATEHICWQKRLSFYLPSGNDSLLQYDQTLIFILLPTALITFVLESSTSAHKLSRDQSNMLTTRTLSSILLISFCAIQCTTFKIHESAQRKPSTPPDRQAHVLSLTLLSTYWSLEIHSKCNKGSDSDWWEWSPIRLQPTDIQRDVLGAPSGAPALSVTHRRSELVTCW